MLFTVCSLGLLVFTIAHFLFPIVRSSFEIQDQFEGGRWATKQGARASQRPEIYTRPKTETGGVEGRLDARLFATPFAFSLGVVCKSWSQTIHLAGVACQEIPAVDQGIKAAVNKLFAGAAGVPVSYVSCAFSPGSLKVDARIFVPPTTPVSTVGHGSGGLCWSVSGNSA